MPTDLTYGQHFRNQFWDPNRSTGRNIGSLALNILRSGGNPFAIAAGAAARAGIANGREAVMGSNWYQSQFGGGNSMPGGALPGWMNPNVAPGAPAAAWNPYTQGAYGPNYNEDQTYAGPPEAVSPLLPPAPSGPVGPSRGNQTIAEGEAAQGMAQGMNDAAFAAWGAQMQARHRRMIGLQ